MKTPLLAIAVLAFATFAHAALDVRTASVARQSVAIDGNSIPEIKSWSGGESVSEVITARNGGNGGTSKSLGRFTYEPIVIEAAPPFSPALQACIAQFLGGNDTAVLTSAKKTLLLAYLDASGQPIGDTLQATGAQLTEIQFPAFDAASRTPLLVKFTFRADSTTPVTATVPAAAGGGNARNTNALSSNFTLAIDGLSTSRVSKIDSFILRREVVTNTSGTSTATSFSTGQLILPNLVVTLGGADSDSWKTWRASFLPQTDATTINRVQKKNGTLQLLAPDMTTPLFTLQLSGLAPVRFATVPPESSSALLQFRSEIFCESMSTYTGNGLIATAAPVPGASKLITREPLATRDVPAKSIAAPAAGNASADDKGSRDPADFPRPPDVVRTSYSSTRDPNSVREIAYYTGKTNAAAIIAFYEKSLQADGWKESSRQEDNSGPGKTFRITSNWTKEKRSAQLVLGDIAPEKIEIYVSLLEKK